MKIAVLRALPDHVESRDRKGIAQFQRVGACLYRKSRATFSGHALAPIWVRIFAASPVLMMPVLMMPGWLSRVGEREETR
jgi:hypothetical protein